MRTILFLFMLVAGSLVSFVNQAQPLQGLLPVQKLCTLRNAQYVVLYDRDKRLPVVVSWYLTRANMLGRIRRTNDFRYDARLTPPRAELVDYVGSGYDRGHMAPSADFRYSENDQSQTFLLSNMAPQTAVLNRGAWKVLESLSRSAVLHRDSLIVICGPLFLIDRGTIGPDRLQVPSHFFKILCYPDAGVAAFIFENTNQPQQPLDQLATVDSIEALTGFDFLQFLPDTLEQRYESGQHQSEILNLF